jgi:hypothetical protein
LLAADQGGHEASGEVEPGRRTLGKRLAWIAGMSLTLLLIYYISLRLTSDTPSFEQRQAISKAVALIEAKGFSNEAFLLRALASFRTTDNWWNIQTGHKEAYAATNFPFEIITVYPEFFDVATDDTERAAILLHEAEHMMGSGEEAALEAVWRQKKQLGWTGDRYSGTKVWKNTKELTQTYVSQLFVCGDEKRADCTQ